MKRLLLLITLTVSLSVFSGAQSVNSAATTTANPILRFFPNPAVTYITFDFQKSYENGYTLQIFNFLGKQVYEAKNIASQTKVDLSAQNRGIYMYYLRDKSGKLIESGKFQISK